MDATSLSDGGESHHSEAHSPHKPAFDRGTSAWNGRAEQRPRMVRRSIRNLHGNYVRPLLTMIEGISTKKK